MSSEANWNKKLSQSKNPFSIVRVSSVWQNNIDVESINQSLTKKVLNTIAEIKSDKTTRMILSTGQAGIGKTHFISRLRRISKENNYLFIMIEPITSPTGIFSHIYRQIFVSLRKKDKEEKFSEMEKLIGTILTKSLLNVLKEKRRTAQSNQRYNQLIDQLEVENTVILNKIESDPNSIELIKQLSEIAIESIERDYPSVDLSFLKVLFNTLDKDHKSNAMHWLQGEDINEDILNDLGVIVNISDERVAQRVLYSILILTDKPFLLCFDQIESINDSFHDPNIIIEFFNVLVRLCNETPNTLIFLMVLAEVWQDQMKDVLQDSTKHRIDMDRLQTPSSEEMVKIVEERLNDLWGLDPLGPDIKTYPFSSNYIINLSDSLGRNPRLVLRHLSSQFQSMEESKNFHLLDKFEFTQKAQPSEMSLNEYISYLFSRTIATHKEDPEAVSYIARETYLQAGFLILFRWYKDQKLILNDLTIIDVKFKSTKNPIDLILEVESPTKTLNKIGIVISNTDNGNSFTRIIKMIQTNINTKIIDNWVLIRDQSLIIKSSWKKGNEVLKKISSKGFVLPIEVEDDTTIYACKHLLDLSSSGDLEFESKRISREEILSYFKSKVVQNLSILDSIFQIKRPPHPLPSGDIRTQLLALVKDEMMVTLNKVFPDFEQNYDNYRRIVFELADESKLMVLIDVGHKLVVSNQQSRRFFE